MLNQNTKKSFEIEFALFNCAEKMGMNNFGSLNSSLSFFYFYFATNLKKKKKKKNGVRTLTAEPPPPSLQTSAVLAGPPLPFLAYVLFR